VFFNSQETTIFWVKTPLLRLFLTFFVRGTPWELATFHPPNRRYTSLLRQEVKAVWDAFTIYCGQSKKECHAWTSSASHKWQGGLNQGREYLVLVAAVVTATAVRATTTTTAAAEALLLPWLALSANECIISNGQWNISDNLGSGEVGNIVNSWERTQNMHSNTTH
jgi:hypothetical protein